MGQLNVDYEKDILSRRKTLYFLRSKQLDIVGREDTNFSEGQLGVAVLPDVAIKVHSFARVRVPTTLCVLDIKRVLYLSRNFNIEYFSSWFYSIDASGQPIFLGSKREEGFGHTRRRHLFRGQRDIVANIFKEVRD